MEDRTLVELYWARDPRALSETAAKYGTYCREIARNILGSVEDAAECVNDTYLHAWNSIPPTAPLFFLPTSEKSHAISPSTDFAAHMPANEAAT